MDSFDFIDIVDMGLFPVGTITVICFLIGLIVKTINSIDKYIPPICGLSGCMLGLIWFLSGWPGITAQDPITAAAIGIVSGLSSTGIHQTWKQFKEN